MGHIGCGMGMGHEDLMSKKNPHPPRALHGGWGMGVSACGMRGRNTSGTESQRETTCDAVTSPGHKCDTSTPLAEHSHACHLPAGQTAHGIGLSGRPICALPTLR